MRVVSGKKVVKVVKAADDRFRLFLAAAAVGSAAGAVALAQEWLSEPQHRHFSHDLLGYQALQHRLVSLTSRVAAARLAVQCAAAALDSMDKRAPAQVALAKRYCVANALSVLEDVRTMFGASSVHVSYPLARVRRNLISYQLLGGDMEVQAGGRAGGRAGEVHMYPSFRRPCQ
ncbi:hypothetical protein PLESTM_001320200 [Pleodorina starrii]|nr:hypothetical protein PLESTM_001320200 [Pleodorina starrii]